MTPTRFNWSTIDRRYMTDYVLLLSKKIVDIELTIDQFHNKITTHIKKLIPVKFKKNLHYKVKNNYVWIGGTYYSDLDQDKKRCIELVFEYPLFYDTICVNQTKFNKIAKAIADTLLHEIIHMSQHRKRNYRIGTDYKSNATRSKIRFEQEYLGSPDEIDAYSFNIACELNEKFKGDKDKIIEYINDFSAITRHTRNSWKTYAKAFDYDQNHIVIKRVKKKVISYLSRAKKGKPYQKNKWIQR